MLSWNEIRERATRFSKEWATETNEDQWAKTFWSRFFEIFGVRERSLGLYEKQVEKLGGTKGYIDFFSPGSFIVEHKSAGKNLDSAYTQASDYALALSEDERPHYIIVSDFARIRLYDLEAKDGERELEFHLRDLPKYIRQFAFIAGLEVRTYREEDPVNRKAIKLIIKLYSSLAADNYPKEDLGRLLVRLVFCFFADDTGIFEKDTLYRYLALGDHKNHGFGAALSQVFEILNTKIPERQGNLDEDLSALPYVNGGLFAGHIRSIFSTSQMREEVLRAAEFNWGAVSPAIFGSMFQFAMDATDSDLRHDFGAHYTSEKNILKVIDGLFLDGLKQELEAAGKNQNDLNTLWNKLASITLLDPACGCGNFLVVAYRELRHLELEIIKRLYDQKAVENPPSDFDIKKISKLSVEQMFGIELQSFPAEIAKLSLWLADHMANIELGNFFGRPFSKLPLTEQPHILCANALTTDWKSLIPKNKLYYILGNPPFIGSKIMTDDQRKEITEIFHNIKGAGTLDYVSGWYAKAGAYIQDTKIKCAFVSTNSITQGEQVGTLWQDLVERYGIRIHFAHRTFKWSNEAPGRAAVYCVIVGFASFPPEKSTLFNYADVRSDPVEMTVSHINHYLVDAPDAFIESRSKPISDVPEMKIGNKPIDGGNYLFTPEEKAEFLFKQPEAEKFFRRWLGSDEFINGYERWCLYLGDASPEELRSMPEVMRRIEAVRLFREISKSAPTRKLAETPTRFHVENIPKSNYLVIPEVSSENRKYIPIGFLAPDILASNLLKVVANATLYHFGVLESEMHMAWTRTVCGRLESRYRYSKDIVYNNFPWPENPSAEQKHEVEQAAQAVLDARKQFPNATLADLYDPDTMPKPLLDAHHALDRAVDRCYGTKKFSSEPERLEFLFEMYKKYLNT